MKKLPKKFKQHKAGRGGWSEWVNPKLDSFLFKCCDCELIHQLQFGVFLKRNEKRGAYEIFNLPDNFGVKFRARRFTIPKELKRLIIKN